MTIPIANFCFVGVLIARRPILPAGFPNLGVFALDGFRFLLVETNQFRSGLLVDSQQFVQFGVQRQAIPSVARSKARQSTASAITTRNAAGCTAACLM
jgi:hypothetical protein